MARNALGRGLSALIREPEAESAVAPVEAPVAVPAAAYTGWNPRRSTAGLPNTLYERLGSKLAFPPGRPTVVERYSTPADYTAVAQAVAQQLAGERLLLPQDIGVVVAVVMDEHGKLGFAAYDEVRMALIDTDVKHGLVSRGIRY